MGLGESQARWVIPAVLFILAFILRMYFINAGLFDTDAVIAANAVENTFKTHVLHYMQATGFPGYVVVLTTLYAIYHLVTGVSSSEFVINFVSVLFGSLGVSMIYLLSTKLTNSRSIGLFSALILIVLPTHLSLSTYGKDHALGVFLLMTSAYMTLRANETDSDKHKILAGLFIGYSITVRLTDVLFLPILFLLYWRGRFPLEVVHDKDLIKFRFTDGRDKVVRDVVLLLAPIAVLFLVMYYRMFSTSGVDVLIGAAEYNKFLGFFTPLVWTNIGWITSSITYLGWALFLIGVVVLLKRDRYMGSVLLLWFLVYFFYYANIRVTSHRFLLPALVAAVIFMAAALDWVRSNLGGMLTAGVVLTVFMALMFNSIYPVVSYRSNYCGSKEFAYYVRDYTPEDAVIIVMDESVHINYYANRNTLGHSIMGDDGEIARDMQGITSLLENNTPVYVVTSGFTYDYPYGLQFNPSIRQIFNQNTGRVYNKVYYDPNTNLLSDQSTNLTIRLTGKYMLELLDNFKLTPIGSIENEDWHHKSIWLGKFESTLYKIEER